MKNGDPIVFSFLLLPGFSSLPMSSAVEPLLICNRLEGEDRYKVEYLSENGLPVVSSSGLPCVVDKSIDDYTCDSVLMICGCTPADHQHETELVDWLKAHHRRFSALGGVSSGGYLLAEAGLLKGRKASIHWWGDHQLKQQFVDVNVSNDVFSLDCDRFTCKGGTAALDMMLMLVGRQQGRDIGEALAQYFVRERVGGDASSQRKRLSDHERIEQPKLAEAIDLMEANIEEPLTADDIARHVAISRRQLERIYKKYLDTVPSKYYLQIRLDHGRSLLHNHSASIADVALSCGFSSGAHFSTAYRNFFGLTPSEERARG
ncbi:GlxA family transcriptional regulator [Alkalimarinus sediminis]|uniref:GlxA family transcriptional regulator n=1 Tax=Alkalimarinus sediminis TaxID=1632866 RepID=A0A9E8HH00_9ALTE|nr:GlxA family transcriptional regulator [Alkalimarinus sediminis]UZW74080.1 GlxA family transcriptional regulator [Alkalimarinus sediminis]